MCPRNRCAIIATTLCLLLGAGTVAEAGPPTHRGCARASGNCSKRKLDGRHYLKMNLTRTRWVRASLFMSSFRFSDLWHANFRGAKLKRADLSRGNRTSRTFRSARMTGANLANADFYGSNFRGADLQGANLTNARLDNSNLFFANFKGANFNGTSFNNIRLCHTIQPNGVERNDQCGGSGGGGGSVCCFPGGSAVTNTVNGVTSPVTNAGDGVLVGDL
jgi:hypothetical protein